MHLDISPAGMCCPQLGSVLSSLSSKDGIFKAVVLPSSCDTVGVSDTLPMSLSLENRVYRAWKVPAAQPRSSTETCSMSHQTCLSFHGVWWPRAPPEVRAPMKAVLDHQVLPDGKDQALTEQSRKRALGSRPSHQPTKGWTAGGEQLYRQGQS